MTEDSELLRQYSEDHSEAAFTELVRRRIDLVYSVALRQGGGDVQLAEDVTQQTFVALARKARSLSRHPSLGGWLYRAAQFGAIDAIRAQSRRREREQETTAMNETTVYPGGIPDWEKLRPALDLALSELGQSDRDAVSLRFFENRTFGDIGRILSLQEETARKRVERALDRLHAGLARTGITSSTAALAVALGSQVNAAAPARLASQISQAALSSSVLAGGASVGTTLLQLMSTSKITLSAISAIALLGIGAAVYEAHGVGLRQQALETALRQRDEADARTRRTERSLQAAEADNTKLLAAASRLQTSQAAADIAAPAPNTQAAVQARYRAAQQLARRGDTKGALKEYLWLFDHGMREIGAFGGVRLSYLLSDIAKLGPADPDALAALRERRDQAKAQADGGDEPGAAQEMVAINHALGDDAQNLAYFDQLAADAPQRRSVGSLVYDQLVAAQRYSDALQSRPFSTMTRNFDMMAEMPAPNNPAAEQARRQYLVDSAANNIEVLAGAGDLGDAQTLAKKVLAYDASDATRMLLQARATRGGHPDLLTSSPSGP